VAVKFQSAMGFRVVSSRLTGLAKTLRRQQTAAEAKLWSRLRDRRLHGWKFKRQVPFGPYILDYFCFDGNLVVEVDGSQHEEQQAEYDRIRTQFLEREGLTVLRFWNNDVLEKLSAVEAVIYHAVGEKAAPTTESKRKDPSSALRAPSPEGEGRKRE